MNSVPQPPLDHPASARARLDLVPVDPHRLFADWNVPSPELARLREMAGTWTESHHLTLRLFRLPDGNADLQHAIATEDFSVGATCGDGYFSVSKPGGCVAGVLGIKNAENRFTPAITSERVTLPQAPRPPAATAARGNSENPVASEKRLSETSTNSSHGTIAAPPTRKSSLPQTLDESAVVAAAGRMTSLPAQLRSVPGSGNAVESMPRPEQPGQAATTPHTPALDERRVVTSALRHMLTAPAEVDERLDDQPAATEPRSQSSVVSADNASSFRLASQMGDGASAAPLRLRATLVVTGRLAPGQKLRVGNKQIAAAPGGRISFQHQLDSVDAIWPLLLHAVLHQATGSTPSVELLSEMPDSEALLSLHASIDIEGEIHDPTYRARLPRGITVDGAGRFRVVRPLPAGALLLPHLVLVAGESSARPVGS